MVQPDLYAIAFPKLDPNQLAIMGSCTRIKVIRCSEGQRLIVPGQHDFKFYVVKSGRIEILDESGDTPKTIRILGPGEFTGEVSLLTGGPSLATILTHGDCEVYEVSSDTLREMVNRYPELGDEILQAFLARRQLLNETSDFTGVRVFGSRYSPDTSRVRDFLTKNRIPFRWVDIESDPAVKRTLDAFGAREEDTPVVAWGKKLLLKNPSNTELADSLGIRRPLEKKVYDLVVVGAGPAGLGAAVYAGSEGLKTLLLDRMGPGGQTGQSSKIENYLGFPSGLPGAELGNRGYLQAVKFGVEFRAPFAVHSIDRRENGDHALTLCNGQSIRSRTILVATGASYRRLPVDDSERFEGAGVYYAATSVEARVCRGSTAIVVGGGNSAGQAVMYLSQQAAKVILVHRGDDLRKRMSDYLCRRIEHAPNVEVMFETVVESLHGARRLSQVVLRSTRNGEQRSVDCAGLFSFVGAAPHTEFLDETFAKDEHGFLRTGAMIADDRLWLKNRTPCELETTRPGVFAAGDVRSGTTKRCAFAVGDGALAVTCVHWFLAQ
jgi:thioredoxin reductase (NADPH)